MLINAGANIDIKNDRISTKIVKIFIDYGADVPNDSYTTLIANHGYQFILKYSWYDHKILTSI